jgi:hypothetical protein
VFTFTELRKYLGTTSARLKVSALKAGVELVPHPDRPERFAKLSPEQVKRVIAVHRARQWTWRGDRRKRAAQDS